MERRVGVECVAVPGATEGDGVQVIRWVMLGFTVAVLAMFFPGKVGKRSGLFMLALYGGWVLYIAYRTVAV